MTHFGLFLVPGKMQQVMDFIFDCRKGKSGYGGISHEQLLRQPTKIQGKNLVLLTLFDWQVNFGKSGAKILNCKLLCIIWKDISMVVVITEVMSSEFPGEEFRKQLGESLQFAYNRLNYSRRAFNEMWVISVKLDSNFKINERLTISLKQKWIPALVERERF